MNFFKKITPYLLKIILVIVYTVLVGAAGLLKLYIEKQIYVAAKGNAKARHIYGFYLKNFLIL